MWPGPLSWSNWQLKMLVFVEEGKPGNPEKNPRRRREPTLNPHMAPSRNRTRATLQGGERSQHCAISAPTFVLMLIKEIDIYMVNWPIKKTRVVIGSPRDLKFKLRTAKIDHCTRRVAFWKHCIKRKFVIWEIIFSFLSGVRCKLRS